MATVDVTRHDFIDFPMAWALQRELGVLSPPHDPRCSSVPGHHPMSGPGFLCDCGAIQVEWRRRRRALGLAVDGAPEDGAVDPDADRRRDLVPYAEVLAEFGPEIAYREARPPLHLRRHVDAAVASVLDSVGYETERRPA